RGPGIEATASASKSLSSQQCRPSKLTRQRPGYVRFVFGRCLWHLPASVWEPSLLPVPRHSVWTSSFCASLPPCRYRSFPTWPTITAIRCTAPITFTGRDPHALCSLVQSHLPRCERHYFFLSACAWPAVSRC